MARAIAIFGWLGAAWLLWSGHFDALLLSFGVLSCLAVVALSVRMDVVDPEGEPYHLWLRTPFYVPWLLWEIALSNFHIARVILSPSLPIEPRLLRIKATQKTELGNAIFANSITLTPGTVTLDVRGGSLLVHALTAKSAEGLLTGEMDRRVSRLERGDDA